MNGICFTRVTRRELKKCTNVSHHNTWPGYNLTAAHIQPVCTWPDVRSHTLSVRSSAQVTKCVSPRKNITCRIPDVWPEKTVGPAKVNRKLSRPVKHITADQKKPVNTSFKKKKCQYHTLSLLRSYHIIAPTCFGPVQNTPHWLMSQ